MALDHHLAKTLKLNAYYAVKRSSIELEPIDDVLRTPGTKRRRLEDDVAALSLLDIEGEDIAPPDMCVIRLVMCNPGKKKVNPLPIGVGVV